MNKEGIEKRLSDHALTVMVVILGVAVLALLVAVGVYFANFHGHPLAEAPDRWGQFGDFLGGALNPVFGFLSVLALLVALVLQNRELRLSTEELRNSSEALKGQNKAIEHQSFEQTFFAWLNNYHELLQSVTTSTASQGQLSGRQALFFWWGPHITSGLVFKLGRREIEAQQPGTFDAWIQSQPNDKRIRLRAVLERITNVASDEIFRMWGDTYLDHEYQLDSLFRNLYRLVLWVDSQHESQLTKSQKWLYVGIIRGQLSWVEQVYLFYNGLTTRGAKFRQLVNKYALFDNLTFENDPVLEHVRRNQPTDAAYDESAFNSVLARRALGLPDTAEETMAIAAVEGRLAA